MGLYVRGPVITFDNRLKNMLKTSQDRLVRVMHERLESLFFLFSDAALEVTNRASSEGADRQSICAGGGTDFAREISSHRCHGGLGDFFVRTRMDYFSDQTHDIPRLAGLNTLHTDERLIFPSPKVNLKRYG
ncbi:MAG TPA: hypothetical protein VMU78_10015 [Methylocella sp.]|nr:hypothetical protein [Methylocella sp.]